MAVNEELAGFVRDALEHGASRQEIEEVLSRAGWAVPQVWAALAAFADLAVLRTGIRAYQFHHHH